MHRKHFPAPGQAVVKAIVRAEEAHYQLAALQQSAPVALCRLAL